MNNTTPAPITWDRFSLRFDRKTLIMGILNITPDSFSDGGRFYDTENAIAQARQLVEAGADILDIGGESTRPFSEPVPEAVEMERVVPVIEKIASKIDIPISIDTTKAAVARAALDAGAAIINDISALGMDAAMASLAAETGAPLMLMHMLGKPKTMQVKPFYKDVVKEVCVFLQEAMDQAVAAGVAAGRIILDPGIGFGKRVEDNLTLLNAIDTLAAMGRPVLIGTSRKAFIRTLLAEDADAPLSPDHPVTAIGTQATVAHAALSGAHIVRVHDVARTRATLKIIDALKAARPQ